MHINPCAACPRTFSTTFSLSPLGLHSEPCALAHMHFFSEACTLAFGRNYRNGLFRATREVLAFGHTFCNGSIRETRETLAFRPALLHISYVSELRPDLQLTESYQTAPMGHLPPDIQAFILAGSSLPPIWKKDSACRSHWISQLTPHAALLAISIEARLGPEPCQHYTYATRLNLLLALPFHQTPSQSRLLSCVSPGIQTSCHIFVLYAANPHGDLATVVLVSPWKLLVRVVRPMAVSVEGLAGRERGYWIVGSASNGSKTAPTSHWSVLPELLLSQSLCEGTETSLLSNTTDSPSHLSSPLLLEDCLSLVLQRIRSLARALSLCPPPSHHHPTPLSLACFVLALRKLGRSCYVASVSV